MADFIDVTGTIITISAAATTTQAIDLAIDVSAYDELDLAFVVHSNPDKVSSVAILTSMQNKTDDATWSSTLAPATITGFGANASALNKMITGSADKPLLRYIRWQIVTTGAVSFSIQGLARRKSF